MKLLITGGAGFIGSNFIRYWLATYPDDFIVNFDILTYAGNLENLIEVEKNPHYKFIKGDITDPHSVAEAMKGIDTVIHFAAETHVDRSILSPDTFIHTNIIGTFVLLEEARKTGVRFHHVSTDEVFGSLDLNSSERFTEATTYKPNSPYSASKASSDHLVRAYFKTYNLPITISNTSNNFGPFQFPEKLIPLAITNVLEGKKVPVYMPGNQVRDWIFVDDHCRGIDLILHSGKLGETYLLGGPEERIDNMTMVKKILNYMGKDESLIELVTDRPGHDVRYAINWEKSKNELGYMPQASIDEFLQRTISWYDEHRDWWKRVKSGEYQHYYQEQYGIRLGNQRDFSEK